MTGTDSRAFFLCPISGKALRAMSKDELSVVNQKIVNGELYFHPGIQIELKLKQAYITENQTYIYPVVDDILLLKKVKKFFQKS